MATNDDIVELNEMQSRSMIADAMKVGLILAENEPVQDLMHKLADAKDFTQRGPVATLVLIEPILRKAKVWDNLPVPNTSSGNNPGKWKSQVKGKGKAGNMVTKQYDFYRELIQALPEVKDLNSKKDTFEKVLNSDDVSGIPDEIINMSSHLVKTKRDNCLSRINTILKNVKTGILVRLQMERLEKEFPEVRAMFLTTIVDKKKKTEEIVSNPKCILVGDNSQPDKPITAFKTYDATGFVGLDLDLAAANGGTYNAVIKSAKKETGEPETQVRRITKYDDFLPYLYEVAAYVGASEHYDSLRILLKDAKRNKEGKNDMALAALDELRGDLVGLLAGMEGLIKDATARLAKQEAEKQRDAS